MPKPFTMLVDRQHQNKRGKAIVDFKAYFDALISKCGYIVAKRIIRTKCHIFVVLSKDNQ